MSGDRSVPTMESATWCRTPGRGLRREQVAAGGLEEFQHGLVFERRRIGEVDHHLGAGHGLFDALAGNGVDAALRRRGNHLVAAPAQNGDGLRADQAGAANDDDLHGSTLPLLDVQVGAYRATPMPTREFLFPDDPRRYLIDTHRNAPTSYGRPRYPSGQDER